MANNYPIRVSYLKIKTARKPMAASNREVTCASDPEPLREKALATDMTPLHRGIGPDQKRLLRAGPKTNVIGPHVRRSTCKR